jgi:putative glutamine amidotransferase
MLPPIMTDQSPYSAALPPVVGIPCCLKQLDGHPFQAVGEKYVVAVSEGAGCTPFLIPSLPNPLALDAVLDRVDGLLITGSPSNVEPRHYSGPPSRPGTLHDPQRDALTLPLLRAAIDRGIPFLAICRGFQELNVALGGTLHQHLEEIPGRMDHRGGSDVPAEAYRPKHTVALVPGGRFAAIGGVAEITVNSVHGQGIDRLAPGLVVEGTAPDGTIEAVRVADATAFALAVQWHPEWRYWEDAFSTALFRAFGAAVRTRAEARNPGAGAPRIRQVAHG